MMLSPFKCIYIHVEFPYSCSSPVDAFLLIEFNVHDGISIAGLSPHIGAI